MKFLILIMSVSILSSCDSKQKIELLVYNATVYTVDSNFSKAEAIAVNKGKIVAVGNSEDGTRDLVASIDPKIKILDTVWDDHLREEGRVLAVETDKAFQAIPSDADW